MNPNLGERLLPGEMVVVGDPDSLTCTRTETDLMAVAETVNAEVRKLSKDDAQFIFNHYELLAFLTTQGNTATGATAEILKRQLSSIQNTLRELEQLHQRTYQHHGRLSVPEFFEQRQRLFQQLDFAMGSMMTQRALSLPDSRNLKRSLGLSSKSLVHHWKRAGVGDIPGYATNHQAVSRAGVYARGLGLVGIGLDGATSGIRIKEACTEGSDKHCEAVTYQQTGRFAGSTIFGGAGASAGAGLCFAIGAATAGMGGLACAVVLGATGGIVGGNLGSDAGKFAGEKIYERLNSDE